MEWTFADLEIQSADRNSISSTPQSGQSGGRQVGLVAAFDMQDSSSPWGGTMAQHEKPLWIPTLRNSRPLRMEKKEAEKKEPTNSFYRSCQIGNTNAKAYFPPEEDNQMFNGMSLPLRGDDQSVFPDITLRRLGLAKGVTLRDMNHHCNVIREIQQSFGARPRHVATYDSNGSIHPGRKSPLASASARWG